MMICGCGLGGQSGSGMKISFDANVLVRAVLNDDPAQFRAARELLKKA
jgi:hypothetical protein